MSELQRLFDEEVKKVEEAILWELRLDWNEHIWGSAYGPWLPPTTKHGFALLIL